MKKIIILTLLCAVVQSVQGMQGILEMEYEVAKSLYQEEIDQAVSMCSVKFSFRSDMYMLLRHTSNKKALNFLNNLFCRKIPFNIEIPESEQKLSILDLIKNKSGEMENFIKEGAEIFRKRQHNAYFYSRSCSSAIPFALIFSGIGVAMFIGIKSFVDKKLSLKSIIIGSVIGAPYGFLCGLTAHVGIDKIYANKFYQQHSKVFKQLGEKAIAIKGKAEGEITKLKNIKNYKSSLMKKRNLGTYCDVIINTNERS